MVPVQKVRNRSLSALRQTIVRSASTPVITREAAVATGPTADHAATAEIVLRAATITSTIRKFKTSRRAAGSHWPPFFARPAILAGACPYRSLQVLLVHCVDPPHFIARKRSS